MELYTEGINKNSNFDIISTFDTSSMRMVLTQFSVRRTIS